MSPAAAAPMETTFAPVRSQTVSEETIERIGTAIKLGLLVPGERLPAERDLCLQLGISRSTLRQALTWLGRRGYLRATRGRGGGTFVAAEPPRVEPPLAELLAGWREACDGRMAVELGIAALAAERARAETLDRLDALVEAMDDVLEDFDAYRHLDVRLHITLAQSTGSRRLVAMATGARGVVADLEEHFDHPPEHLARDNGQHRRLIAAVREGDAVRATAAMAEHLRYSERRLEDLAVT